MLIIQRRPGEAIVVANEIEIQIIEISPSRVKLGIVAPRHIPVFRKETQQAREQNLLAALSPESCADLSDLVSGLRASIPPEPPPSNNSDHLFTGPETAPISSLEASRS